MNKKVLLTVVSFVLVGVNAQICPDAFFSKQETSVYDRSGNNRNKEICAYKGIRYARAPVGDLRFRLPEKNTAWQTDRSSEGLQNSCMQWNTFPAFGQDGLIGKEDCLYLDVYTPKTPSGNPAGGLPVIVLIHGGDFESGGKDTVTPDYIMDQSNVILVVINYRLGVLGFLSTDDDEIPGNLGLLDQVMALQWVNENIRNFGGNPSRVTLMGFGSGGVCVAFHTLSQKSRALFQRAIISGGSAVTPNATSDVPIWRAFDFGKKVDCSYSSSRSLRDCLRKVSAEDLVRKAHERGAIFRPIVEGRRASSERQFLYEDPRKLYQDQSRPIVPTIYGYTKNAGSMKFFDKVKYITDHSNLENMIHLYLDDYFYAEDSRSGIATAVKYLYFSNDTRNNGTASYRRMTYALTDFLAGAPVMEAVQSHLRIAANDKSKGPFVYVFGYSGGRTFANYHQESGNGDKALFGATYMDDMMYVLTPVKSLGGRITADQDRAAVGFMSKLITDFATVEAIDANTNINNVQAMTTSEYKYQNITQDAPQGRLDTVPYRQSEYNFWTVLIPELNSQLNETTFRRGQLDRDLNHFRSATWGTTTVIVILVLACIALAYAVYIYRKRSQDNTQVVFSKKDSVELHSKV